MAKYHIDSIQNWEPFEYGGNTYTLTHLDVHEIIYKGVKATFKFVVTYGLHCFTKENTSFNIPVSYQDGREAKDICMERYEASKQIRRILENLPAMQIFHTDTERYFTLQMMNSATNQIEPYKICVAIFKENRLIRMHVLSAFFVRTGPGAPGVAIPNKPVSIFKIAMDTEKKPRNSGKPKEVNNRKKT